MLADIMKYVDVNKLYATHQIYKKHGLRSTGLHLGTYIISTILLNELS